jgi:hypothetical protein
MRSKVSFLWQLLPGAREARNQLIIGYAWVLAAGLWLGVPQIASGSELDELVNAAGPLGVGVAVSFASFLLGSFSDDLFERILKVRGARALTRYSDVPPVLTVRRMEEWGIRSELERLEASIDRSYAEVLLRFGLIGPVGFMAAAGFGTRLVYGSLGLAVVLALIYQGFWRRIGLRADLEASEQLRLSVASQLEDEPETQEVREREAQMRELEERERAAALEQERERRAEQAARPRRAVEKRIAELEQVDAPTDLDKKELSLLHKLAAGLLSSADANELRAVADTRASELQRDLERFPEDAAEMEEMTKSAVAAARAAEAFSRTRQREL